MNDAWCVPLTATPDERAAVILNHVYDGLRSPRVRSIAADIRARGASELDRAALALATAQAAGFRPDVGCDRYAPVEYTLAHGGDCDDLTPLVMCLAIASGIDAAMVYMPQTDADQDHVSAQLLVNGQWMWAEPSLAGARIGEHPYTAVSRLGHGTRVFGGTGAVSTPSPSTLWIVGLTVLGALAVRSIVFGGPRENPFAGYRNFAACARRARYRGIHDPGAYCATIERRSSGTRRRK